MNDLLKDFANGNVEAVVKEVSAQDENCELTEVEIEGVPGGTMLAGIASY